VLTPAVGWPGSHRKGRRAAVFCFVPELWAGYIEATDFRLQDSKDYYGLAPGKSAMLRWGLR
jgi:glutaminyl-tRNA synthetase